jgi:hypothetical protein
VSMAHGDLDGTERNQAPPVEDKWAHVEELKRVANRYLDEHHHEPPKIRELPVAHYEVIRDPTWFANSNRPTCGARARVQSNFGTIGGTDVVSCSRSQGHLGRHSADLLMPTMIRLGEKVASWERSVDENGSLGSLETPTATQPDPNRSPLSKKDRWWNLLCVLGFALGLALTAAITLLAINGRLWQSAICYVIALVVIMASLLGRMPLIRRHTGK